MKKRRIKKTLINKEPKETEQKDKTKWTKISEKEKQILLNSMVTVANRKKCAKFIDFNFLFIYSKRENENEKIC